MSGTAHASLQLMESLYLATICGSGGLEKREGFRPLSFLIALHQLLSFMSYLKSCLNTVKKYTSALIQHGLATLSSWGSVWLSNKKNVIVRHVTFPQQKFMDNTASHHPWKWHLTLNSAPFLYKKSTQL